MTEEQFNREFSYQTSRMIFKSFYTEGVISKSDYNKILDKLIQKYNPIFGGLKS